MTLEEAFPLISATTNLVSKLIEQIMDSAHMSEEQRKQALSIAVSQLDATAQKIKNVQFHTPNL